MSTIQELQANIVSLQATQDSAMQSYLVAKQAVDAAQQTYDNALQDSIAAGTLGTISSVTSLLVAERNAGIQAAATLIQTTPTTTLEQALAAWTTAATTATTLPSLLQDPNLLFNLYAQNLHQAGAIPDTTWESMATWIVATPLAEILAD